MEETSAKIEELTDNVKEYINTRIELMKLKVSAKLAVILSNAMSRIILILFLFMFIMFISITAGFWLSKLTGGYASGFLILSGIYLLLFILFFIFRKHIIIEPMKDKIIKQIFDEN